MAVRTHEADEVIFVFTDHLGSVASTWNDTTDTLTLTRYYPYGGERHSSGEMPQDQRYTAQTSDATANASGGSGLLYYNARYYDPTTAQFTQPDTIVPAPANPADLNRYSYVRGNPVRYADPSGNCPFAGTPLERLCETDAVLSVDVSPQPVWDWVGGLVDRVIVDRISGKDVEDYRRLISAVSKDAGMNPLTAMAILRQESHLRQRFLQLGGEAVDYASVAYRGATGGQASVGFAQMQFSTFAQTIRNHPEVFGDVPEGLMKTLWIKSITNNSLSITVSIYHMADLNGELPTSSEYSDVERIALGYNAPFLDAREILLGLASPSGELQSYLENVNRKFVWALFTLCGDRQFACSFG